MQRVRAFWEKIKADVKRAPAWVWVGLALTLVLVYFAWRSSRNGSTSADTSALPLPDSGGVGGGGALPLPTPPSSSDLPLIPAPPNTLGADSFSDLVPTVQVFGRRVAEDIRSGHGPYGLEFGRRNLSVDIRSGHGPYGPVFAPRMVQDIRSNWSPHYATEGNSSAPTTFRMVRGHGEVID